EQLYDGFINDRDRRIMQEVRDTKTEELSSKASQFNDSRLKNLMPLDKACNFPKYLDETERNAWERYQKIRLENQLPRYFERLAVLSASETLTSEQQYLLEELRLYGESLLPGE